MAVQNHLQNAAHFVGVAYPPNRFPWKSIHSCKHDSHFCMKICLALNSYKKIMIAISSRLYYNSVCRRISPSKILLTNPLLIIYTPLERPDSSPVGSFFFPVFMRLPGLFGSRKVSVYLLQKMTFLDGCTQFCTQVAENWGRGFFGQFCLLTRHKK